MIKDVYRTVWERLDELGHASTEDLANFTQGFGLLFIERHDVK